MARGKPNLAANVNENNIINTNEHTGSVPFFIIDDEYGIAADEYCYALCIGKKAYKKDEDNPDIIISYIRWTKISYYGSIWETLKGYAKKKERAELSKLKNTDIGKVAQISESIKTIINNKMNEYVYDKNIEEIGKLEHTRKILSREIEELMEMKNALQSEYDGIMALLKEIKSKKLKVN